MDINSKETRSPLKTPITVALAMIAGNFGYQAMQIDPQWLDAIDRSAIQVLTVAVIAYVLSR